MDNGARKGPPPRETTVLTPPAMSHPLAREAARARHDLARRDRLAEDLRAARRGSPRRGGPPFEPVEGLC